MTCLHSEKNATLFDSMNLKTSKGTPAHFIETRIANNKKMYLETINHDLESAPPDTPAVLHSKYKIRQPLKCVIWPSNLAPLPRIYGFHQHRK